MTYTKVEILTHLDQCYVNKYGFPPNQSRQNNYKQIVDTLDNAINKNTSKIQVLCPPTGTGKTFVLAEYVKHCLGKTSTKIGSFDIEFPNSILIVVRTTVQADDLVKHINADLSEKIAISCHAKNQVTIDEVGDYQALVITHAAYKNMLLEIEDVSWVDTLRASYLYFKDQLRNAIVIDEKPELQESWICSEKDLLLVKSQITAFMQMEFGPEYKFIEKVVRTLECVTDYKTHQFVCDNGFSFDELLKVIVKQQLDVDIIGDNDSRAKKGIKKKIKSVITLLKRLAVSQAVMQKKGNSFEIAAYIKLMPEDCKISTVILDATASSDYAYELIADRVDLIEPDKHSRTYENLKIHVSEGCKVGKVELVKGFDRHVLILKAALDRCVLPNKKLLLICHKDNVEKISDLKLRSGSSTSIVNWGNIDGKNDYKECDSVFIFGLPYLPNFALLIEVMALTGLQLEQKHQVGGKFFDTNKLVMDLKLGYLASSIIQAINRCQIRTSSNYEGACPSTEIYVPLGKNIVEREFIIASIKDQMPNVNVNIDDWQFVPKTKLFIPNQNIVRLLDYILSVQKGIKHHLKELGDALNISKGTLDRFMKEIRNSDSDTAKYFEKLGVIYKSKPNGRWPEQWLVCGSNILSSEVEHAVN